MTSPSSSMSPRECVTTEPGVAHDWLESVYADYRPEQSNNHRNFTFRASQMPLGRGSVSRLHYSLSADNNVELNDVLLVLQPVDGHIRVRLGRDEVVVPPGATVLFAPHRSMSALWADTDAWCVSLQSADVERLAVETTGLETVALRFTAPSPMSPGRGGRWADAIRTLLQAARRHPALMAHPVIAGQVTQRLAAAALDTFPSTALESHRRIPPDHATPAVVRRAVDFIETNAARELTLSEIAAASGIGPRGLQGAFLRHQDTTPDAYVRRVRMDRAHGDLQAADPSDADPVPAIAARWGFPDPRRFTDAYQQAYRQSPREAARG